MQLAQDKLDTIKTGSRQARHHSLQEDTQQFDSFRNPLEGSASVSSVCFGIEGSQNRHEHLQFRAPFDEKCLPLPSAVNFVIKQLVFHIADRRTTTHKTPNPCNTASFVSNPKCLQAFSPREKGPLRTCTPKKRWQPLEWVTRRSRPRWACRSRRRSGGFAAQRHCAKHVINTHLTLHGCLSECSVRPSRRLSGSFSPVNRNWS